jgi:hypothetical protein
MHTSDDLVLTASSGHTFAAVTIEAGVPEEVD